MLAIVRLIVPLLAATAVGVVPIGVLFMVPQMSQSNNMSRRMSARRGSITSSLMSGEGHVLNLMMCFAAGSLIGDALLHMMVHSIFDDYPSAQRTTSKMLYCIVGMFLFLAMDVMTRTWTTSTQNTVPLQNNSTESIYAELLPGSPISKQSLSPPSGTSTPSPLQQEISKEGMEGAKQNNASLTSSSPQVRHRAPPSPDLKMLGTGRSSVMLPDASFADSCHPNGAHNSGCCSNGILSIVADAFHNFTDGLALAAAFGKDFKAGVTTTMAIFFHEVPHQLGDYAVLVKSGYSHQKAIVMQFLTALAGYFGVVIGVAVQSGWLPRSLSVDEESLMPFAAGGFLYVAMCTILPTVLSDDSKPRSVLSSFGQISAFAIGVGMMLLWIEMHICKENL